MKNFQLTVEKHNQILEELIQKQNQMFENLMQKQNQMVENLMEKQNQQAISGSPVAHRSRSPRQRSAQQATRSPVGIVRPLRESSTGGANRDGRTANTAGANHGRSSHQTRYAWYGPRR